MSSKGYVESLLNVLDPKIKTPVVQAFHYVMDNWRIGDNNRAQNAQLYKFQTVTASVANDEFSIHHGQGEKPSKLIPILDLNVVNSEIPRLIVSRAPDNQRIYLKSPTASATITVLVEF